MNVIFRFLARLFVRGEDVQYLESTAERRWMDIRRERSQ